jgi:hypothetical protein
MRALLIATAIISATSVQAQQPITLPIAKGFWTNLDQNCSKTHYGYVFDGKRWGALYFYGPNGSMGPAAELEPITQTRGGEGGFTQMQFGGYDGAGYFRIKSDDATHATYRVGAPHREEIQQTDEPLKLCSYASLSNKMKVAIRQHAPGLVMPVTKR